MSIRKIWACILLDELDVTGGERVLYEKTLDRMSEVEANEVVELLESAVDGMENALERVCVLFVRHGIKEGMRQ